MTSLISQTAQVALRRIAVSAMDNNIYLLTHCLTGDQILIDAADDLAAIDALLAEAADDGPAPRLRVVVTTHSHWDHIRALADLAQSSQARLVAGEADIPAIEDGSGVGGIEGLRHGDRLSAGALELTVIGLRGHTLGSIALAYQEEGFPVHLFTGDSLFPGGVGNTGGDPARFASLLADVKARLFDVFPDQTIVHPGHGRPTTLGEERGQLGQWEARGW